MHEMQLLNPKCDQGIAPREKNFLVSSVIPRVLFDNLESKMRGAECL